MPFITGVLTTIVQFMAGVGGVFLDMFFQKSMLDRKTTLATKAMVQTASHVLARGLFLLACGHRRRASSGSIAGRHCRCAIGGTRWLRS